MAKKVSAVVSGMGLGMSIIQGLVNELVRKGGSPEDIHILATPQGEGLLEKIAEMIVSRNVAMSTSHIIDGDADPFIPDGWKVEEHKKGGQFEWDVKKTTPYLSKKQKEGGAIEGNKLRKELADMPALNANVLDYLLANSHLIPEEWKGKAVFFWGTIYRDSDGSLCLRYLYWHGYQWRWDYYWLGGDFRSDDPAVLRAS